MALSRATHAQLQLPAPPLRRCACASRALRRSVRRGVEVCAEAVVEGPPGLAPGLAPWTPAQLQAAQRGLGPPLGTYSPESLAAECASQPLRVAARVATISATLGGVGLSLALDYATGALPRTLPRRAVQLRRALTSLGPTFVKLGQALSTRPDLLPPAFLHELQELQDALPSFADARAFDLMEAELGAPLSSLFRRITPVPVAAASLGQVYRAELMDGTAVAVKVQRPGTSSDLKLDFYVVRALAQLVDANVSSLYTSVTGAVDDFVGKVYSELDYVAEGRNCERFQALYGSTPNVLVPTIFWSHTSARVLTLSWVEGIKLSDTAALQSAGLDVISLVNTGIQCSLRQLLEHGYFHADPHPGNLLGTADGQLAFIDFGIMSETPLTARHAIIAHVVHLVNRDYTAMSQDYYRLGFLDRSVDVAPIVPALANFFDDVLSASVSDLNFKTITDGLGGILYAYPFNVPGYYALILRSLTVLEGLALSSDPSFKVLAAAYPFFAARLLIDDADALREALGEMVFDSGRVRWARLEGLLQESRKSQGFRVSQEALPTLIDLVLGAEGTPKRGQKITPLSASSQPANLALLAEGEAARVVEALLLGGWAQGDMPPQLAALVDSLPQSLRTLPPLPSSLVSNAEARDLASLRSTVLRIAALLDDGTGGAVDWAGGVAVLRQPRVVAFANAVAQRVAQRALARTLQALLARTDAPPATAAVAR